MTFGSRKNKSTTNLLYCHKIIACYSGREQGPVSAEVCAEAQQEPFICAGICGEQSQTDSDKTPSQKAKEAVQCYLLVG